MSRIDIPTLKCDRCGFTTQATSKMVEFMQIRYDHMSGRKEWDLCSNCRDAFRNFMESPTNTEEVEICCWREEHPRELGVRGGDTCEWRTIHVFQPKA